MEVIKRQVLNVLKEELSLTALSVSTSEGWECCSQKCLTSVRLLLIVVGQVSESVDITGSNCVGGHFLSVLQRGL